MIEDDAVKVTYMNAETHAKYIKMRRSGNVDYDILV